MRERMNSRELELYVHIPFCVQKCNYCDFLSAPATKQVQNVYMEALIREIGETAEGQRKPGRRPVTSIFIGGGTPSAVDPEWMEKLMRTVRECYRVEPEAEISMEVNPGTVTKESLARYRRAGINRLSIGCQSTDDGELVRIGRVHTFAQFLDTYRWAREVGFDNVNVDLMNALPGQTLADVERNLDRILRLEPMPEHISVYSLIVEEGTPFYEMQEQGELALPDEDLEREIYWYTAERLKRQGYEHYEISNFAKPDCQCRHNCGYWERREYLGFGLGAASLCDGIRFSNTEDMESYLEKWSSGEGGANEEHYPEKRLCVESAAGGYKGIEHLSVEDQMAETMFLGLRMAKGVSCEAFQRQYGIPVKTVYSEEIEESVGEGLLRECDGRLVLTKRGLDICNYVMAKFLKNETFS